MFSLSFRKRILLALLLLGALPASLSFVGWVVTIRNNNPAVAGRAAFEDLGATGRDLLRVLDSTRLTPEERVVLNDHTSALNAALARSQQAEAYSRMQSVGVTLVLVSLGSLFMYLAFIIGRSLSRQLSAPIEELIGWTGHIRRQEPLPATELRGGAPEFASLRMAIRNMALELYQARNAELEAERLRAFREVARRVAHEMKNPLTPVRLAVRQLHQTATEEQQESLEVLIAESARLEQLAREFAELGRLPEGPSAEVDLAELLGEILKTSLPQTMTWRLDAEPGPSSVVGHYDPLRRALGNLVRNAVEATDGRGLLEARVVREGDEVIVSLADHGPGIPEEKRSRIFEPYYTGKADGTGLGLAIVKQVIDHHHGNIVLRETPGGGATFEIRLPAAPEEDPT